MKRQSAARRRSSEQNSRTNPTEASSLQVSYGECRKNHAAKLGGYAVDGCREFMPTSNDVTSPASFFCAACGCHRNFHRPEVEPEVVSDSSSPTSSTYN